MGEKVLFVCNLPVSSRAENILCSGDVERKTSAVDVSPKDLERIVSHWNPRGKQRQIDERFAANSELWLVRCEGVIAAYGWTIKGRTMESHFFPLTSGDIHLFDFFVFPEFRGRRLNPVLVWNILVEASRENLSKAFIEAAGWNKPQILSLARTPFRQFGVARKLNVGKLTLVSWSNRPVPA